MTKFVFEQISHITCAPETFARHITKITAGSRYNDEFRRVSEDVVRYDKTKPTLRERLQVFAPDYYIATVDRWKDGDFIGTVSDMKVEYKQHVKYVNGAFYWKPMVTIFFLDGTHNTFWLAGDDALNTFVAMNMVGSKGIRWTIEADDNDIITNIGKEQIQ